MKVDEVLKGSYQRYIAADFLSARFFNKRIPLVIAGVKKEDLSAVRDKLLDSYGDVSLVCVKGENEAVLNASELALDKDWDAIILEACAVTDCKRFDFYDFVEIMKRLRADDGCEWDRAQTHESIRINLIEEAYELVEAIDCKSADMMREECGDVLMQAVFHTEIAEKNGEFNYGDMLTELCRKLIDRHTHIFGANHANNPEEALAFWNEAKKKEKKYSSTADSMERVPKNLPALLYAEKLQKRAKKVGFDWNNPLDAVAKVVEELEEIKSADDAHKVEEAGDLLFAAVNVARLYGVEPEMALREASYKFLRRFASVEKLVEQSGKQMSDYSLEELDKFWEQVKSEENGKL
ncbi:MAG: nucleoside triphosphate pyrophosphohydrolase [Bacteroides sp.]|nr:nucleoside triphosphate pyrophosphohydrolase [Bacillota bacterium]MCM1393837.1 nucleoside triphosphate pyrophosphohydrolase [[Eubacterium] siraeum]MCM1456220.1 nucleoside triphosphate pyrophosphohydrolase [Bacteroides sp.]